MSLVDELVKVLNEVDPETGLTYRDQIMKVARERTCDPRFVELLERAKRIGARRKVPGQS
jgi:hypothetical protein